MVVVESSAYFKKMFAADAALIGSLKVVGDNASFDDYAPAYLDGQSVSGVQRKLFMRREGDRLMPAHKDGDFIVKPCPKQFSELPANEYSMMTLASVTGIDTAQHALVPFEDGELCFVTRRFDLLAQPANKKPEPARQRYFIEDAASLCQINSKHKGSDALSYETTLKQLYQCSGANKVVLLKGFQQVLFAYLIGNNDLHLKNFSMYRKPDDRSTLMRDFTPAYDILSVAPYPAYYGEDLTLCVLASEVDAEFSDAYEQYGYYTRPDFVLLAEKIGLGATVGERVIQKMINQVSQNVEKVLNQSVCSSQLTDALKAHIEERLGRMQR